MEVSRPGLVSGPVSRPDFMGLGLVSVSSVKGLVSVSRFKGLGLVSVSRFKGLGTSECDGGLETWSRLGTGL